MSVKDQNPRRRMVGAMVVAVVMVFLFVWFFGAALHRPQPHDVPVGIVGPELLKERVVAGAQANAPGAFSFQSLSSAADARSAIEDRDVAGALIIGSGEPQILVAGAGGQAASGVISGTFVSMAKAFGQAPVVEDVQPLPESDTLGLVPFFLVLGVTVSAFVFQLLAREQEKGPTLRAAIMSLLVFAVVTGLVAGLAVGIGVGFAINYWALAGVCALLALAVAAATLACCRLFGRAGVGIAGLVIILLGNASSGSVIGSHFLPQPFRWLSPVLPAGSGLEAARSVLYFDGGGVGWRLVVLALWVAGAFAILAALGLWRGRTRRPVGLQVRLR